MKNIKSQNIYDNETFFEGYKELRNKPNTANDTEEKPAFFSLLPDLNGLTVLDLGCGFGENCEKFVRLGAARVIASDISEKMLEEANQKYPVATYVRGDMSDLSFLTENGDLPESYDLIVSSLALHYIEDFPKLAKQVYALLNNGGHFIFSQEHPLTTAPLNGATWEKNGEIATCYKLSDYGRSGERKVTWFVNGVTKYHRTFSELFTALLDAGFTVKAVVEPFPSEEDIATTPKRVNNLHKPNFLLIKAEKQ